MRDRHFRVKQVVKRVTTGERVTVVEILPIGLRVFYRVEYENGDVSVLLDSQVRDVSMNEVACK
jgi:hypothetical protein